MKTPLETRIRQLAIPTPPGLAGGALATAARDAAAPRAARRRRPRYSRIVPGLAVPAVVVIGIAVFLFTQLRPASSAIAVAARPGAAQLTCRLPISALSADHTTGFIVVDHGRVTFQPASTSGTTYVLGLRRWVDVLPQMVAPDGSSYVTQQTSGSAITVHIVDAKGDRTVLKANPGTSVFGYSANGILLTVMPYMGGKGGPVTEPPPSQLRLQLLDPASGAVRDLPAVPFPSRIDAGSGEAATYLRAGDAIWIAGYDAPSNTSTLTRYDLATGTTAAWFFATGHLQVVAADAQGRPIVQVADRDLFHTNPAKRAGIEVRTMLLDAAGHSTVLNQGRVGDAGVAGDISPTSATDGVNVWLAADDGTIWLYDGGSGLSQVANVVKTSKEGPPGVVISGPCR